MMRRVLFGFLAIVCFALPCAAAGLQLSIQDGKVSIDAQDVTIRQILTEWARVGKTRIVNVERLAGGPITIKLEGVPEKQALDIILRAVPGYVASPRETFIATASVYDTILIMATTTPVATMRAPAPAFGGLPGGANSITQLRQPPPFPTGTLAEPPDPANDQLDDAALAAAAAAGLVTVPALAPVPAGASVPLQLPGGIPQAGPLATPPAAATPANPWNAPVGAAQPGFSPQPPPTAAQPILRPRPPQADR